MNDSLHFFTLENTMQAQHVFLIALRLDKQSKWELSQSNQWHNFIIENRSQKVEEHIVQIHLEGHDYIAKRMNMDIFDLKAMEREGESLKNLVRIALSEDRTYNPPLYILAQSKMG